MHGCVPWCDSSQHAKLSLPKGPEGVLGVILTPPNLVSSVNVISVLFTPGPVALAGV